MTKQRIYIIILFIFVLAFLAGNFVYPNYFNKSADYLNQKLNWHIPHFWNMPFKLGLDLQGGSHLLYEADLSQVADKEKGQAMEGLRDVIERRVNLFGVSEPVVQIQQAGDSYRLIVELAGVIDPAEAVKQIGQTPFLEFREQRDEADSQRILAKVEEVKGKTTEEAQQVADWRLALEDPYFRSTQLTGRYLKRAEVGFEQNVPKPLISIEFDSEGSKMFEELTQKNIGKPIAIYIDGVLISAPIVQARIVGGKAQITGNFDIKSAQQLARNLNAGALPLPISLVSQQSVGPILGKVSLDRSLKAGMIGFLLVIVFMVIFYRVSGLLASLALLIYVALVLSLFKLFSITLTLAGIAGFILSIGMAVDANILIFARMKEEVKDGKSFSMALSEGFHRAWPSIRDSNFNTLIICLILFGFGTSFVKGFALTLILGVLVSMFSAITITRYFLRVFENTRLSAIKNLWG